MTPRVGVITIHGMGRQAPDFDRELRDGLLARLDPAVARDVLFEGILYSGVLEREQTVIWDRMRQTRIDWQRLREFFLFYFSDATAYQYKATEPGSAYLQVHGLIREALDAMARHLERPDSPIIVMAHSLGAHVMSNYVWDAWQGRGLWIDMPSRPIDRFETCAAFLTAGCNIPLFAAGLSPILPFPRPNPSFRWLNYYDRDDVLGWPLGPLSAEYAALVTDVEINAGSIFTSLTPLSHVAYWTEARFLDPAAQTISAVHAGLPARRRAGVQSRGAAARGPRRRA